MNHRLLVSLFVGLFALSLEAKDYSESLFYYRFFSDEVRSLYQHNYCARKVTDAVVNKVFDYEPGSTITIHNITTRGNVTVETSRGTYTAELQYGRQLCGIVDLIKN